jgi:hypothetical protein
MHGPSHDEPNKAKPALLRNLAMGGHVIDNSVAPSVCRPLMIRIAMKSLSRRFFTMIMVTGKPSGQSMGVKNICRRVMSGRLLPSLTW